MIIKKLATKPKGVTRFQTHKDCLKYSKDTNCIIIDFTEYKLLQLISQTKFSERKIVLLDILSKYQKGILTIGWENGNRPIFSTIIR